MTDFPSRGRLARAEPTIGYVLIGRGREQAPPPRNSVRVDIMGDAMFDLQGRRVCVVGRRGMSGLGPGAAGLADRGLPAPASGPGKSSICAIRPQSSPGSTNIVPMSFSLPPRRSAGSMPMIDSPPISSDDNLAIAANVIEAAHRSEVRKLVFFGTSCMYPKLAAQPILENSLLEGPLEPTNEWYARGQDRRHRRPMPGLPAAIRGCDFVYRRCRPTCMGPSDNLRSRTATSCRSGPDASSCTTRRRKGDRRDRRSPGVTGRPRLRVSARRRPAADAAVLLLTVHWSADEPINVGTGEDIGIAELAETIARIVRFKGRFAFDLSKPDGAPRKALDASKLLALGWRAQIGFDQGIREAYDWFRKEIGVALA